jgi:hypothetical protein
LTRVGDADALHPATGPNVAALGFDDLLFLHLLEPHSLSEAYVDSVLLLFKALKVKKYCLLGSMYDVVPHTRPLIVNGGAVGRETALDLKRSEAQPSAYQVQRPLPL